MSRKIYVGSAAAGAALLAFFNATDPAQAQVPCGGAEVENCTYTPVTGGDVTQTVGPTTQTATQTVGPTTQTVNGGATSQENSQSVNIPGTNYKDVLSSFLFGGFAGLFGNKGPTIAPNSPADGQYCVNNSTDAESFLGIYSYSTGRDAIPGMATHVTIPEFLKLEPDARKVFVEGETTRISEIEDKKEREEQGNKLTSWVCMANKFAVEKELLDMEGQIRKEVIALNRMFDIWLEQQKHACNAYVIPSVSATYGHGKGGAHDHNAEGINTCDKNARIVIKGIGKILKFDLEFK